MKWTACDWRDLASQVEHFNEGRIPALTSELQKQIKAAKYSSYNQSLVHSLWWGSTALQVCPCQPCHAAKHAADKTPSLKNVFAQHFTSRAYNEINENNTISVQVSLLWLFRTRECLDPYNWSEKGKRRSHVCFNISSTISCYQPDTWYFPATSPVCTKREFKGINKGIPVRKCN